MDTITNSLLFIYEKCWVLCASIKNGSRRVQFPRISYKKCRDVSQYFFRHQQGHLSEGPENFLVKDWTVYLEFSCQNKNTQYFEHWWKSEVCQLQQCSGWTTFLKHCQFYFWSRDSNNIDTTILTNDKKLITIKRMVYSFFSVLWNIAIKVSIQFWKRWSSSFEYFYQIVSCFGIESSQYWEKNTISGEKESRKKTRLCLISD